MEIGRGAARPRDKKLMSDTTVTRVTQLIEPALKHSGFDLVRVQLSGGNTRPVLQIMAEPIEQRMMTVEDCAEISHYISAILDVHDPIANAYALEVSSPGIDRPLTRSKDFSDWTGHEAQIETQLPVEDRKRFRGILGGLNDNEVQITVEKTTYSIPFRLITKARLILTDALIDDAQSRLKPATSENSEAEPEITAAPPKQASGRKAKLKEKQE